MLKRTDWRALQQSADDASEPKQLKFAFSSASASMSVEQTQKGAKGDRKAAEPDDDYDNSKTFK
jgi:hypothetical protein